MTHITYEFEEVAPYEGLFVLVSGKADITGYWQGPDREIGEWGGWDYEIESIYINSLKFGEPAIQLDTKHPLYDLIEKQLLSAAYADSIRGELEDTSNA